MGDEDREALADALRERDPWTQDVFDALLPVVEAIARRRAAKELRAAAEDVDDGEFSNRWSAAARSSILARADALDSQ